MRVLKWTVPVDDQWHPIGSGEVLHVACQRGPFSVEVWTLEADESDSLRSVIICGTGQPLPENSRHIGTALANQGSLVWHVFEGVTSDA